MKSIIAVASVAFVFGGSSLAFAQAADNGMGSVRAACADDMAKLCPDAKTREDRHQCMMQNRDKVSDTCKAAAAAMRQKMQEMKAAPAPGAR